MKSQNRRRDWLCLTCKHIERHKGRPDNCFQCGGRLTRYHKPKKDQK